jgi:putative transposase
LKQIRAIHQDSRRTYGSPRITHELREKGYRCSRPRVARLMRRHGIYAKTRRKFKLTTQSSHRYPVSPNLLDQDFTAGACNEKWVSDITYIRTKQGWLYLTIILDLCNREIVGWSMSKGLSALETVVPAFKQAFKRKHPGPGLIFHSDQGVQYACEDFRKYLRKYDVIQSMSSKGNCYDNAVAESFFHTLKTEHVYFHAYQTREQARESIFEYIEIFYNRRRKHSALGYKTPIEFINLKRVA